MSHNMVIDKLINEYQDGDIEQAEFVGKVLEEISYDMPTTFWCHVIRMKSEHDHIGDEIT